MPDQDVARKGRVFPSRSTSASGFDVRDKPLSRRECTVGGEGETEAKSRRRVNSEDSHDARKGFRDASKCFEMKPRREQLSDLEFLNSHLLSNDCCFQSE